MGGSGGGTDSTIGRSGLLHVARVRTVDFCELVELIEPGFDSSLSSKAVESF